MRRRRKDGRTGQGSSQKSMGEFFGRERSVEIIDDDEIEEISAKEANNSSRSTRFTRRQRRLEDSQSSSAEGEDWKLQEALRISKAEAEKQDERRRWYGDQQDVEKLLQFEIEPTALQSYPRNRGKRTKPSTELADTVHDEKDRENTASPELFSTPPEGSSEQLSYIKTAEKIESDEDEELACSPVMPVTNRPTEATVSELDKDPDDIKLKDALLRQNEDQPRRKLTLRRTKEKQSKEEKIDIDNDVFFDEADKKRQAKETENPKVLRVSLKDDIAAGGKRKLMNDDDDDDTTDDEEPFQVEKRKRTRVNLSSDDSDEVDAEMERETVTKRRLDWLENVSLRSNASVTSEEAVRNNELEQVGEPRNPLLSLRLTRRYKKSRRRPSTVKEAMKANLYFAPPGFDLPAYTKLIIKMLERYRRRLHTAQTKIKTRIPWGDPVRVGSRQGDTLDSKTCVGSARKYRATATTTKTTSVSRQGKDTAAVTGSPREFVARQAEHHSELPVPDRKRTLRSLQEVTVLETASVSRAASSTSEPLKVDSESDCDDQELRSYIDTAVSAKPETASETSQTDTNATENQTIVGVGDNSLNGLPISGNATSEASTSTQQISNSGMSVRSRVVIGDDHTEKNKVQLMDSDVEYERPPKRRSVLRDLPDDSTDDESDSFRSLFASLEKPSCSEGSSKEVAPSTEGVKAKQTVDDPGDFNNKTFNYTSRDSTPPLQYSETHSPVKIVGAQTPPGSGDESLMQQQTSCKTVLAVQTKAQASSQTINTSDASVASSSKSRGTTSKDREQDDVEIFEMFTTGRSSSQSSRTLRRSRSEVAAKAAAAAERRQQGILGIKPEEARLSSVVVVESLSEQAQPKASDQQQPENRVECPLCFRHFSPSDIETHASDCQGQLSPTEPSPSSSSSFPQQLEETATSRTESQVSNNQALAGNSKSTATWKTIGMKKDLRDLRVVLQRSPAADRKLRDKVLEDRGVKIARKNLTFQQDNESSANFSRSDDQSDTVEEGITARLAEKRVSGKGYKFDLEDYLEGDNEEDHERAEKLPEKMASKWMRASSSKGNSSKSLDALGEFIPLNSQLKDCGSSSDQSGLTSPAKQKQSRPRTRNTAMESDDADSSDADGIMAQYGAPQADKQSSASPKMDIDEGTDENEKALTLLGQKNLNKRRLSRPETSKSKKACTGRSSDSEGSDDCSILCTMCDEKLAKADFDKHVEEEIAKRNRMPRKVQVVLVNGKSGIPAREGQRRFETSGGIAKNSPTQTRKTAAANVDDNNTGIDWDEVSNSPIKCFQFTGNTDSGVDFDNQFAHLKEGRSRTRQSRNTANVSRGTGQRGTRGSQRGRYFYRRGNQFNKFRGRRQKKK